MSPEVNVQVLFSCISCFLINVMQCESSSTTLPGEISWKRDFQIVYCSGPIYLDVGKSSYVRLVSWIFPLILQRHKTSTALFQFNMPPNPSYPCLSHKADSSLDLTVFFHRQRCACKVKELKFARSIWAAPWIAFISSTPTLITLFTSHMAFVLR